MTYDHLIGAGFARWHSGEYTEGQLLTAADTTSPSILYTGAYRAGKSEICSRLCLRHAMVFPGAKVGVFRAKLKSLRQSTLKTLLELVHPTWVVSWSNSELELRLHNGSTITFLGCDFADRIGSIELSMAFIDEAHEVSKEAYGMITGRLSGRLEVDPEYLGESEWLTYAEASQAVRQVLMACNPKSRGHWLYKEFIDPDARLPGRQVYSSNTICNRNLPPSYLEQNLAHYARPGVTAERLMAEVRRVRSGEAPEDGLHLVPLLSPFGQRNLLGLWVALEGAIFEYDADLHTEPFSEASGTFTWVSVDFGYHHPRAVLGVQSAGSLTLTRYWHGSKSDPQALLDAVDSWGDWDKLIMPPDQPGVIQAARERFGASKVWKANNKVLPGIGVVQTLLNRDRLKFRAPKSPRELDSYNLCLSEFEGYRWKQDNQGNFLDEPLKEADHFPDAIRYLLATLYAQKRISLGPDLPPTKPEDATRGVIFPSWLS